MDVELMRADPAGLNEIKSASPETFNPREIAIGTPAPCEQSIKKSSQMFECA